MDRSADAIAAYTKAIALEPNLPEASFGLGVACERLGRSTDAIAAYERFLRLKHEGPTVEHAREAIRQLLSE